MARTKTNLKLQKLKTQFKVYMGTLSTILNYISTDIAKKPRSFKIGVFSVFIVVVFLTLLESGLSITPIMFLKIAEDQAGAIDLILAPVAAVNDTRIASVKSG
jgi:hypothetical protein